VVVGAGSVATTASALTSARGVTTIVDAEVRAGVVVDIEVATTAVDGVAAMSSTAPHAASVNASTGAAIAAVHRKRSTQLPRTRWFVMGP
jgi:hypothetical protein